MILVIIPRCIYRYGFEQTLGDIEKQGVLVCCNPRGLKFGHDLASSSAKESLYGNSLVIQWLELGSFTAEGPGWIPLTVGSSQGEKKRERGSLFHFKIPLSSESALAIKEVVWRVACGEDIPGIPQILLSPNFRSLALLDVFSLIKGSPHHIA